MKIAASLGLREITSGPGWARLAVGIVILPVVSLPASTARINPSQTFPRAVAAAEVLLTETEPDWRRRQEVHNPFRALDESPVESLIEGPRVVQTADPWDNLPDEEKLVRVLPHITLTGIAFVGGAPTLLFQRLMARQGDYLSVQVEGRTVSVRIAEVSRDHFVLELGHARQAIDIPPDLQGLRSSDDPESAPSIRGNIRR